MTTPAWQRDSRSEVSPPVVSQGRKKGRRADREQREIRVRGDLGPDPSESGRNPALTAPSNRSCRVIARRGSVGGPYQAPRPANQGGFARMLRTESPWAQFLSECFAQDCRENGLPRPQKARERRFRAESVRNPALTGASNRSCRVIAGCASVGVTHAGERVWQQRQNARIEHFVSAHKSRRTGPAQGHPRSCQTGD